MNHRADEATVSGRQRSDSGAREETGRTEGSRTTDESLADLLSDPHCRYLLEYLRTNDNPVSVSAVARYVVSQVTDAPVDDVSNDVERRVQTWFHHGQLPMLDDHGVVDFDPDSGTVRLADDPNS